MLVAQRGVFANISMASLHESSYVADTYAEASSDPPSYDELDILQRRAA